MKGGYIAPAWKGWGFCWGGRLKTEALDRNTE